jgi:tetratricopeptide (TPR) repeat protein
MLEDFKRATQALEKAAAMDPNNSNYFDWLGKVYGKRAETSNFMTAWSYAGKCRNNFERAIELDGRNLEAIDDLFEFDLNAPSFIGGGIDKAATISERVRDLNQEKYHGLQARLAEKQKDFSRQEKHLRLALDAAPPSSVGRVLDLAQFLAKQGRFDESEAMFERAKKIAPQSAELKFKRAKTYLQSGRNRQEARKLLQQYLESSLTPDDPPRSEAERLLKEAASG